MPQTDPAERVVDRREPRNDAAAALQLRLQFGERDVGGRFDQSSEVGLIRREHGATMSAIARRCWTASLPHAVHHLIAVDGLTAKRRAASRIELPRSTARTIRLRRSKEIGAGITTSRLSQPLLSNHRLLNSTQ